MAEILSCSTSSARHGSDVLLCVFVCLSGSRITQKGVDEFYRNFWRGETNWMTDNSWLDFGDDDLDHDADTVIIIIIIINTFFSKPLGILDTEGKKNNNNNTEIYQVRVSTLKAEYWGANFSYKGISSFVYRTFFGRSALPGGCLRSPSTSSYMRFSILQRYIDFLVVQSTNQSTRFKLYKQFSSSNNTRSSFFTRRVISVWNNLPMSVEFGSLECLHTIYWTC